MPEGLLTMEPLPKGLMRRTTLCTGAGGAPEPCPPFPAGGAKAFPPPLRQVASNMTSTNTRMPVRTLIEPLIVTFPTGITATAFLTSRARPPRRHPP